MPGLCGTEEEGLGGERGGREKVKPIRIREEKISQTGGWKPELEKKKMGRKKKWRKGVREQRVEEKDKREESNTKQKGLS